MSPPPAPRHSSRPPTPISVCYQSHLAARHAVFTLPGGGLAAPISAVCPLPSSSSSSPMTCPYPSSSIQNPLLHSSYPPLPVLSHILFLPPFISYPMHSFFLISISLIPNQPILFPFHLSFHLSFLMLFSLSLFQSLFLFPPLSPYPLTIPLSLFISLILSVNLSCLSHHIFLMPTPLSHHPLSFPGPLLLLMPRAVTPSAAATIQIMCSRSYRRNLICLLVVTEVCYRGGVRLE